MLKGYNKYAVTASANAQTFSAKTHHVEANAAGVGGMGGMGAQGSGGFGGTASAIKGFFDKLVMDGIIMDKDAALQRRMARDMYRYDAICGGAVDLMALLPWSNAQLSGVADKKIREKYQTCVQSMNMMMLMPEATVDHLVNAQFIGSMHWDESEGTFIGISPQDPEQCVFQHVPFYGKDPLISLKFGEGFKQLVEAAKKDPRAAKILQENAPQLAGQLAKKEIPLDPDTTVYVPRRTFASQVEPTSFLTRVMPVWIIEKALMRGTIELSYKRQKSIMHVLLGGEDWEPTVEEATNYVNLFQAADSDPTSAIVATRPDVLVTEVRGASDFWRYDEIMESTAAFKYRGLGFNESFLCLTGDSLVKSENGLLRIDSISGDRENSPIKKGFDIDLQVAGRFKKETAAKWLYSGFAPTLKITAENGQQLKGTKKHPALVLNQFDTEWVELNNLRVGDLLCVDTKPFTRKAPLNLDLEDPEVHPQSRNLISPYKPKRMTPDLAFAMGLVVAEGCVDDYRVRMCNSNDELIAVYRKKIKDVFRLTCNLSARSTAGDYIETFDSVCTKTVYDVCCNSKTLSDWFQQLGVSRSRSKNGKTHSYYKHVPWSILEADEQSQLAYIAAYVEGDGSIQDNGSAITLFSRSMKNLRQMQALLNAHGILASVRRHKKAGRLQLTKENSLNLYRKIEPYLITKKVSTIHETIYHDRKFGIPTKDLKTFLEKRFVRWETNVGGVLLNDEGKEIVIPNWGQYFSRVVTTCKYMLYANYREGLYDEFLSRLRIVSKTVHEKIVTLLKLEYQFIPVTEIKKNGRQHVYDLSMKPGVEPAFVANGFVVHNTGDANFNTMENALSTFLERLKYLRYVMTNRIFYNKVFPYIAVKNDFKVKGEPKPIEVTGYYEERAYDQSDIDFANVSLFSRGVDTLYCRSRGYVEVSGNRFNPAEYQIPHLSYVKALKPEADSAYLDIMKNMEERGIPVPLQMWASASGFNINELMRGYEDDVKYRKAINAYLKKIPTPVKKKGVNTDDDDEGSFEEASFRHQLIAGLSRNGRIGLGARKFTDRDNEMRDPETKKVLSRKGRDVRLERLHRTGAKALTAIAERDNYDVKERIEAAAKRLHTYAGLTIPVPTPKRKVITTRT